MSATRRKRLLKGARGFTLLELLMVVVIIAILSSIAIPQYIRTVERARMSEALSMLGQLHAAQVRMKAERGSYSTDVTLKELDVDPADVIGVSYYTFAGNAAGFPITATRNGVGNVGNCKPGYILSITAGRTFTGRDCQT